MKKRIVICADGTWNRPERDVDRDRPTNVLRLARAVRPVADDGVPQQVFYDWGVGSYYVPLLGGVTGEGVVKNVQDAYRYIVQNYNPGDELFLFGFSRGAYTVRSLAGFINTAGILKRPYAARLEEAFRLYKDPDPETRPDGKQSVAFRWKYAYAEQQDQPTRAVAFMGLWDTVGALGIPASLRLGRWLNGRHEFHDRKTGRNVRVVRHALAIDEERIDFTPALIEPRDLDVRQVWFAGSHADVGGGPRLDFAGLPSDGALLSDYPLGWILDEAQRAGLSVESHLVDGLSDSPIAPIDVPRRYVFRFLGTQHRPIDHVEGDVLIHVSVKRRWEALDYRPPELERYLRKKGGWDRVAVVGLPAAAGDVQSVA